MRQRLLPVYHTCVRHRGGSLLLWCARPTRHVSYGTCDSRLHVRQQTPSGLLTHAEGAERADMSPLLPAHGGTLRENHLGFEQAALYGGAGQQARIAPCACDDQRYRIFHGIPGRTPLPLLPLQLRAVCCSRCRLSTQDRTRTHALRNALHAITGGKAQTDHARA
jgi:hypothetical protein